MGSNPCGDGDTIESTTGEPTKPIKKKGRHEPWPKSKLSVRATIPDIPRIRPKKINTAAADNPISMPPDTDSIGVNSVIIDLPQGRDTTHTIELFE